MPKPRMDRRGQMLDGLLGAPVPVETEASPLSAAPPPDAETVDAETVAEAAPAPEAADSATSDEGQSDDSSAASDAATVDTVEPPSPARSATSATDVAASQPAPTARSKSSRSKTSQAAPDWSSDNRLRAALPDPAKTVIKVQLANRIPVELKARLDRHRARTGEEISAVLQRMLELAMDISERDAGVDKDGNPL